MKKIFMFSVFFFLAAWVLSTTSALATSYYLYHSYGGTYHDAEKSPSIPDDDSKMCWAASAANILAWTGWGYPSGESFHNEDDIFKYFQDHWTNVGGNPYFGLDWWFDGVNDSQGVAGWSQVDDEGGGFWTDKYFSNYYLSSNSVSEAMNNIALLTVNGYGTTLGVINGNTGHAITAWGFDYDYNDATDTLSYDGIWVTDSDDNMDVTDPANSLVYYDVFYYQGAWFLENFYGTDSWYISEVHGLAQMPVPVPPAVWLLGSGLIGLVGLRKRRTA